MFGNYDYSHYLCTRKLGLRSPSFPYQGRCEKEREQELGKRREYGESRPEIAGGSFSFNAATYIHLYIYVMVTSP